MLEFIQREFVLNVKFLKIFKKDVRYKIVSKVSSALFRISVFVAYGEFLFLFLIGGSLF